MQRTDAQGVTISCDFCGSDWNAATGLPFMIEGHHGSCICLDCVKTAVKTLQNSGEQFNCPLCLRTLLPADMPRWSHPSHPTVHACKDCLYQAAGTLSKDPDVNWKWQR